MRALKFSIQAYLSHYSRLEENQVMIQNLLTKNNTEEFHGTKKIPSGRQQAFLGLWLSQNQ